VASETQMAAVAFENLLPCGLFEATQLQADGRLRQVQPPRNPGDTLLFHKHYEGPKQRNFQRAEHNHT
jgi:hypothetical protein